jgi:hypothetical protein
MTRRAAVDFDADAGKKAADLQLVSKRKTIVAKCWAWDEGRGFEMNRLNATDLPDRWIARDIRQLLQDPDRFQVHTGRTGRIEMLPREGFDLQIASNTSSIE